jgi:AcrR family transcriptional regulator
MTTLASKSEHTYAAIVDTAFEMASMEGIGRLSLGEVAKRTGLSKSGVFSRVGSLESLQQAVLDEYDRRFAAAIYQPAMSLPRGLPRLNAIVENWVRRFGDTSQPNTCLYAAGSFEFDDVDVPLRDRLRQGDVRARAAVRRTVLQAMEEGHLRPDTNADQLAFEIYCLFLGLLHDVRFLKDPAAEARVRNAYARLIATYRSFNYAG